MSKTTLLCILDGLGLNPDTYGNSFYIAKTPVLDKLLENCSNSTLITHGEAVGLPAGQMGNSEVGHLNIGAGRVVEQWLLRISRELQGSYLEQNETFNNFRSNTKNNIHLIGLFSDGGVHSHFEHLMLLINKLLETTEAKLKLHLITDGRDTSPNQSLEKIKELESFVSDQDRIDIASISGRYYSMDRDRRWDRTELAYRSHILAEGPQYESASTYIEESYQNNISDEFIKPAVINPSKFSEQDSIIFWNFRADRMRQIVSAICLKGFSGFKQEHSLPEKDNVLCFTEYDQTYHLPFLFQQNKINLHLGQVLANEGLSQIRIAETEKYPHVTYFLNGLIEKPLQDEDQELLPSPREVKTYDQKPEMSAFDVKKAVIKAIKSKKYNLIVVNFANCDMVGHTGVLDAAVQAVETVDACLGEILEALDKVDGQALITADHGNAEQMIKADGSPHTAHTTFPVPVIIYNHPAKIKQNGNFALCDIAPTILDMMDIPKPEEMTGSSILED